MRLRGIFERAERQLNGKQWIAGFRSFADPYLYITLRWAQNTRVDLSGFDNLAAFKRRMDEDSGVRAALRAEGLD
jgi:glutathione S-transferase